MPAKYMRIIEETHKIKKIYYNVIKIHVKTFSNSLKYVTENKLVYSTKQSTYKIIEII